MAAATLTEKGQIVIPSEIRARYELTAGTQVEFVDEGGAIRLVIRRRVMPSDPEAGYGLVKVAPSPAGRAKRKLSEFDPAGLLEAPAGTAVIAVDTNILACFYCDDPEDTEAARQRPIARRVMVDSAALFVPLTVVLEFEWVMRGFYEAEPAAFCAAIDHLLGMPHVTVERWQAVKDAIDLHRRGLDFADALHWASSIACECLVSFDGRGFARRARRFGLTPAVELAK